MYEYVYLDLYSVSRIAKLFFLVDMTHGYVCVHGAHFSPYNETSLASQYDVASYLSDRNQGDIYDNNAIISFPPLFHVLLRLTI
jgi:hypothetical protein